MLRNGARITSAFDVAQDALILTPKVLNSKAQSRPELAEGRTLGTEGRKYIDNQTPQGFHTWRACGPLAR
jgi:hypothetical protein